MKKLSTKEIRQVFLDYFAKNDHLFLQGASIIPKNDPTLLFINSGMAPLKNYFLGKQQPPQNRLCNVQPCIRTNDIEEVGDRHHLTFFEMMGSWSIGDYYKKGAIELAFDLLVNHLGFSPEKLYATVYKGNPELSIPADNESIELWKQVGLSEDHIIPLGEDNFWGPAGETGPCGPCTEVFFDTGEQYGPTYYPGGHFDDVNRYIEIWNAGVFMELNKMANGSFEPLPLKSVDTGSGLERMYLALHGCESLYDVDVIKPVYERAKSLFSKENITENDLRVVTDHMRSSTFILSEGIAPAKDGRGYIVRRLIRKCITVAVRASVAPEKLLDVAHEVIKQLATFYPALHDKKSTISTYLMQEIKDFEPVIKRGLQQLDEELNTIKNNKLDDKFVFDMVTSAGMPFEIIQEYAAVKQANVDKEAFDTLYKEHQEISRNLNKSTIDGAISNVDIGSVVSTMQETNFVGYDTFSSPAQVKAIIKDNCIVNSATENEQIGIILAETPFYSESGGQVADNGVIENEHFTAKVLDVKSYHNVAIHFAQISKGEIKTGMEATARIDQQLRAATAKNHSATHLLHSALRNILGDHVTQKGSLVNADKLRFDYQHDQALSKQQLSEIEMKVNQIIWQSLPCSISQQSYDCAIESGVTALFGEKYGDNVRVVKFGDFSQELCGGTHIKNTGEIGLFKIVSESSIARGIRRIEAITSQEAFKQLSNAYDVLISVQKETGIAGNNLAEQIKRLKKEAKSSQRTAQPESVAISKDVSIANNNDLKAAYIEVNIDKKQLLTFGEAERKKRQLDILLLCAPNTKKHTCIVLVNELSANTYEAGKLLKRWLEPLDGKGGGKKTFAQGGVDGNISADKISEIAAELLK